jgi:hypothetical protein
MHNYKEKKCKPPVGLTLFEPNKVKLDGIAHQDLKANDTLVYS